MITRSDHVPIWQLTVAVLAAPILIALVAAIVAGAFSLPELALMTAAWTGGVMLGAGLGFGILVGLPLTLWRLRGAHHGVLAWTATGAISGVAITLIIIAALFATSQGGSFFSSGSLLILGGCLIVGTAALTAALARGILHVIRSV